MSEVRRIGPDDLEAGVATPGMVRRQAVAGETLWSGIVATDPGSMSGWHHHGDHETVAYVVSGALRIEFGPGGSQAVDAGPGDFVHVPAGVVHREGNPSAEPATLTAFRTGTGPTVINVDGPEPAG